MEIIGLSVSNVIFGIIFMILYAVFVACIISCLVLGVLCALKYLKIFDFTLWREKRKVRKKKAHDDVSEIR